MSKGHLKHFKFKKEKVGKKKRIYVLQAMGIITIGAFKVFMAHQKIKIKKKQNDSNKRRVGATWVILFLIKVMPVMMLKT